MIDINTLKSNYFIISVFCFMLLSNCTGSDWSKENFDYPLLKKNEVLRLAGNYDKCTFLNEEFLKKARRDGYKEGEALCYINLSNICVSIGNYKKGLLFLKKAEEILHKSGNKALKARLFQEYGQLSMVTGLYKNALNYNSKSLYYVKGCSQNDKQKYFLSKVFANRGDFLYEIDRADSSLIYFHKAQQVENTPLINSLIAKHHLFHTERLDSSKFYIDKALALVKDDKVLLDAQKGMVYRVAGDYYKADKNYGEAQMFYQRALDVFSNTNRVYNIPYIYESIRDTYQEIGDSVKEKEFQGKYLDAKSKLSEDQNETVNLLIDKLLVEKEDDIEVFKRKLFAGVAVVIILLMGIFIITYKRLKHNKGLLREEARLLKSKAQQLENKTEFLKNETEILTNKVNESFTDLVQYAKRNDSAFLARFQEIYPDFIDKLLEINPELSGSDLRLCAMIKLNFSSKEIANYMSIQHKSAQQKKYRLRKKLNVPSDQDLYNFFQGLEV